MRRKAGQDAGKIKEDLKMKEMAREAVQAKKGKLEDHPRLGPCANLCIDGRADKELEAKARAAVKLQIEVNPFSSCRRC